MKTLVSAFLPFNGQTNNYSLEVLKKIDNVDKIILDVVYDKCYEELMSNYNLEEYDLIIALGEARVRKELTLETKAYNAYSLKGIDNSGVVVNKERIIDNGLDSLSTKVDLNICEKYIKLSLDPGRFVCNNIYYHLLYNYPEKSLFIHIPECNNEKEQYLEYAQTIMNLINEMENKK